jgi:hypothetical protein
MRSKRVRSSSLQHPEYRQWDKYSNKCPIFIHINTKHWLIVLLTSIQHLLHLLLPHQRTEYANFRVYDSPAYRHAKGGLCFRIFWVKKPCGAYLAPRFGAKKRKNMEWGDEQCLSPAFLVFHRTGIDLFDASSAATDGRPVKIGCTSGRLEGSPWHFSLRFSRPPQYTPSLMNRVHSSTTRWPACQKPVKCRSIWPLSLNRSFHSPVVLILELLIKTSDTELHLHTISTRMIEYLSSFHHSSMKGSKAIPVIKIHQSRSINAVFCEWWQLGRWTW